MRIAGMENREWTIRTRGVVYTIYTKLYVYVCAISARSPMLPCS